MNLMHAGMHRGPHTGEPDHDFVTMMIPHHQGGSTWLSRFCCMAEMRRSVDWLRRSLRTSNREIQLTQLWLKQHEADSQSSAKIRFKTVAVGRGMDKEPLTTRAGGKPGFDIPVCRKLAEMGEKLARESERRSHRAGCSWVLLISTSRYLLCSDRRLMGSNMKMRAIYGS